jgi:hypothetical protein
MEKGKRSAVLRTRRLSGKMLRFLIDEEDETLRELAHASESGRAAKTLVKQGALRITLVAINKGTTPAPASGGRPGKYSDASWLFRACNGQRNRRPSYRQRGDTPGWTHPCGKGA